MLKKKVQYKHLKKRKLSKKKSLDTWKSMINLKRQRKIRKKTFIVMTQMNLRG